MSSTKRLFSAGSRQAPDPNDIFLEKNGLYRKHTARDSTSLFRVISEQLFDTQQHHLKVREQCVSYMRQNRSYFEREVHKKFSVYLDELTNCRTFGTVLELRALAYKYERNVCLYEAQNDGIWIVSEKHFQKCFRVFFTPERHFDSIFTFDYVEKASFCQALCYEILYRDVYQLPDVLFAAEVMLHDPEKKTMKVVQVCNKAALCHYGNSYMYNKVSLDDGREFYFDRPEDTCCILDNYLLCNFHNPKFPELKLRLEKELDDADDNYNTVRLTRMIDSLLPLNHLSCVRQLLDEGITPFPYKVAKSLDPDIYRNIEFDVWSENRKEMRFRGWCHSTMHLQVPYQLLQPHPDNAKWSFSSYRRYNRHHYIKHPSDVRKKRSYKRFRECRMRSVINNNLSMKSNGNIKMSDLNGMRHYRPPSIEMIAMPMIRDTHHTKSGIHSTNTSSNSNSNNIQNESSTQQVSKYSDKNNNSQLKEEFKSDVDYSSQDIDGGSYQSGNFGFHDQMQSNHQVPLINSSQGSSIYYHPNSYNPMYAASGPNASHLYVHPYASHYSSGINEHPYQSGSACYIPGSDIQIQRRDLLQTNSAINFAFKPSYVPNGSDIPLNDLPSLRFFYNLGHEFYKNIKAQYGMNGILFLTQPDPGMEPLNNNDYDIKQLSLEFQSAKIEEIPSTNTPKTETTYNKRYGRSNNNNNHNNNNVVMRKEVKNAPTQRATKNNTNKTAHSSVKDNEQNISEYSSPNGGSSVTTPIDRNAVGATEPLISSEYYQYPVVPYPPFPGTYQPQPVYTYYATENTEPQQYYYPPSYIPPPPNYGIATGGSGDGNNIITEPQYYGYPQPVMYPSGITRPPGSYYYGFPTPASGVIPVTPAQMPPSTAPHLTSVFRCLMCRFRIKIKSTIIFN